MGHFSRDETIYPDDIDVQVLLNAQSPDISQGVDEKMERLEQETKGLCWVCRFETR